MPDKKVQWLVVGLAVVVVAFSTLRDVSPGGLSVPVAIALPGIAVLGGTWLLKLKPRPSRVAGIAGLLAMLLVLVVAGSLMSSFAVVLFLASCGFFLTWAAFAYRRSSGVQP